MYEEPRFRKPKVPVLERRPINGRCDFLSFLMVKFGGRMICATSTVCRDMDNQPDIVKYSICSPAL